MKDRFTHASSVFLAFVLSCANVNACYNLAPSCFFVHIGNLVSIDDFFP